MVVKVYHIMTEHDSTDDAALEIQEEFNALTTTAYAASNSSGEAHELVNAIVAEAREAIDDIYVVERAIKLGRHRPD
jgi:hypothetical protein